MKTYEQKIVPAAPEKIEQRCTGRSCDLCGKKADRGDEWGTSSFYLNDTEITMDVKHKKGYECSDGGDWMEYDIDLCPACFQGKLIPWLESQGAKVEPVRHEW